jgi:two-component system chemotaxis response regulator CheB
LKHKVVLLGASTGGPSQIKELLKEIEELSCTIIINQHMKEEVLPFFIKDIYNSCKFKVETTPNTFSMNYPSIIICSHSSIIEKSGDLFVIKTETKNQQYTPDINQFFNSFTKYVNFFDIDVIIMTGIGSDGVLGAVALKNLGANIYAEDEKSSPVYGMPKAVYERGVVTKVMSFDLLKAYFKNL